MVSMRSEKPIITRFTPSLRSFSNVAFGLVSKFVWLMLALSRPFQHRSCRSQFCVLPKHITARLDITHTFSMEDRRKVKLAALWGHLFTSLWTTVPMCFAGHIVEDKWRVKVDGPFGPYYQSLNWTTVAMCFAGCSIEGRCQVKADAL